MLDQVDEINFDGIIGPTHNYSGLSFGNIASMDHGHLTSNPKKAALQGLEKMRTLASLGIKQAVLPPQERPFIPILRALGYTGSDTALLQQVWKDHPSLLLSCSSSASMWTANAATVTPSSDSTDKRVHFTPANLISKFHRSFEAPGTSFILRRIFENPAYFAHHFPLPAQDDFADEGAANHTRFCKRHDQPGTHLFVYGRKIQNPQAAFPKKFPARQTDEASKAIARTHHLSPNQVIFAQQNPEAIDAGVFHNDVISVGNQNVFLYHEKAFVDCESVASQIKRLLEEQQTDAHLLRISSDQLSLEEAVKTYFFNSQLITLPNQTMALIAPQECQESDSARKLIQSILDQSNHPIKQVIYQDIRESMQNGGGPACLRLRVVLNQKEQTSMLSSILLTDHLYNQLVQWINKYYRDRLTPEDLIDPQLLKESRQALDALTGILKVGPIYPFQLQHLNSPPN